MDDFTQRYAQTLFERDYPAPPPEPVESKPAAASTTGSRARAQETAPGVADAGTALMDMLAGALKGAVAQTIGLPGDVESLYHAMFGGQNKLVTTEDVQKLLPPVVKSEYTAGKPNGMLEPGNIDIANRPQVKNADGSISTVRSIGVNIGGKEVLLPTVSEDGRIMSDEEAIATYRNTGRHLGVFATPQASDAYAESLHQQQEAAMRRGHTARIAGKLGEFMPVAPITVAKSVARIIKYGADGKRVPIASGAAATASGSTDKGSK